MTQLAMDLLAPQAFAAEMRIASAVQWYSERRLSQAKAAEVPRYMTGADGLVPMGVPGRPVGWSN